MCVCVYVCVCIYVCVCYGISTFEGYLKLNPFLYK